jgi:uncharacterized protein (TIGR02186 family)
MKRRKVNAILAIALMVAPLFAQIAYAERLVTSLSTHRVLISSNFTGTSLVLFASIEDSDGTRDKPKKYDVAVTVRGPATTFITRRKERILGLWVNFESRRYPDTPSYLAVLTNRPPAEFGTLELQTKHKLGLSFAALPPSIIADEEFGTALLRVKKADGLFHEETNAVTFLTPTLFRATLPIRAPRRQAPTRSTYRSSRTAYLLRNNPPRSRWSRPALKPSLRRLRATIASIMGSASPFSPLLSESPRVWYSVATEEFWRL